jgi:hypothetical protein
MAYVCRQDTGEIIGYLADDRYYGPLPLGTTCLQFEAWRQDPDKPWQHMQPSGPTIVDMTFLSIPVYNIGDRDFILNVPSVLIDFIKTHPTFREPQPDT